MAFNAFPHWECVIRLHLFEGFEAEDFKALLQDPGGQFAKHQAGGALSGLGFEDRTVLVEGGEMSGQLEEIVAEEIGPVFLVFTARIPVSTR